MPRTTVFAQINRKIIVSIRAAIVADLLSAPVTGLGVRAFSAAGKANWQCRGRNRHAVNDVDPLYYLDDPKRRVSITVHCIVDRLIERIVMAYIFVFVICQNRKHFATPKNTIGLQVLCSALLLIFQKLPNN
jgi:hypothetical protein